MLARIGLASVDALADRAPDDLARRGPIISSILIKLAVQLAQQTHLTSRVDAVSGRLTVPERGTSIIRSVSSAALSASSAPNVIPESTGPADSTHSVSSLKSCFASLCVVPLLPRAFRTCTLTGCTGTMQNQDARIWCGSTKLRPDRCLGCLVTTRFKMLHVDQFTGFRIRLNAKTSGISAHWNCIENGRVPAVLMIRQ